MQTITVKPTSNASGRAQRIAKFAGKVEGDSRWLPRQRTVSVDFGRSEDWNMGNAAGELANVLGWRLEDDIRRGDKWGTFVNYSR